MRWMVVAALLGALGLSAGQTIPFSANASSLVQELQSDDMSTVWGSESVSLMALYDPKDKGAAAFAATWEAVATEERGLFRFTAADGTGALKWLTETLTAKKLPAVVAFPSRLTSSKPLPMLYKGALEQAPLVKWALKQLPFALVSKLTTDFHLKSFKTSGKAPRVCVYHNDSEVGPAIRALSLEFADRLIFGEVKVRTNKTLKMAEKEGITEFPKLVVYKKEETVPYGGPLDSVSVLSAFLEPYALSREARDAIRQERREKYEREQREREEREAKDRADREARRKKDAAAKKRLRREKRKIVKARDAAYRAVEDLWAQQDGELILVRETDWDVIPDSLVAVA